MKTQVKSVMTKKLITMPIGSTIHQAATLMHEKRIRHLPIVDMNADIVGIISDWNLLTRGDPYSIPVEYAMSKHVDFVNQESSLRSTILKMLEKKLSAVLVCDDVREAVGIVTTDDLLWYLAHTLEKETDQSTLMSLLNFQTINRAADQISNAGI
jgi:predicted transcriptional regulator